MTSWSHLPNATHIDRVIESQKDHFFAWRSRWTATGYAEWLEAWAATGDAARNQARWYTSGDAARGAIAALIAWDHSAKFLDMTSKELELWWVLSEDPACILLLPAVQAFEKIKELTLVDS